MSDITPPIRQLIRNYINNLASFPPQEAALVDLHKRMQAFYGGFRKAAGEQGIVESEQSAMVERVQKTLWLFGKAGKPDLCDGEACLVLDGDGLANLVKLGRVEVACGLLAGLALRVELFGGEEWGWQGQLKYCQAARLRGALVENLQVLVGAAAASSPKEKVAYERFLRVNPQAVVAREKPALAVTAAAPEIMANLDGPTAEAWNVLTACLAGMDGFAPLVEFRSIQQGMWVVNYESKRSSGRDLCGLIVQNGEMTARIILYRAGHGYVKEHLDDFGPIVAEAFHKAHYYEEFEHQWLFIPIQSVEDTTGVRKLLAVVPGLLKMK